LHDGSGNNLTNTGFNALGAAFSRLGPARFSDGISALGKGRQLLTGGAGSNTFIFTKTGINAEISDFKVGLDRLQFEGLGQPPGPGGLQVIYENGHAALLFGGDKISLLGVGVNQFRPSDGSFLWGERLGFRADAGVHRTLGSVLIASALLLQTPSGGQD
jgi:hypothetical protein